MREEENCCSRWLCCWNGAATSRHDDDDQRKEEETKTFVLEVIEKIILYRLNGVEASLLPRCHHQPKKTVTKERRVFDKS